MDPRSLSSDEPDVLAANSAFYDALARRDVAAMDLLWARRAPVACIHPGWDALRGREQVMASFRAILGHGGAPDIRCAGAVAHVLGDAAFVICREQLSQASLIATNIFVREGGQWKMAHHQAALVRASEDGDGEDQDDDGPPGGLLN